MDKDIPQPGLPELFLHDGSKKGGELGTDIFNGTVQNTPGFKFCPKQPVDSASSLTLSLCLVSSFI